ncbi:MAG: FecR domain-containing protein [Desulfobacterales bacterium]|nr:FecR domain-containing protein [Desulfobacterales bacterium]
MTAKRNSLFLAMALSLVLFCYLPAQAAPAGQDDGAAIQGVGQIASFTGDVMVRTRGTWRKLVAVPYTVFNTDKVVTRQGRAEIRLADGGIIRVDIDSNITITEKRVTKGWFFKKVLALRELKLLVGKVFLDFKGTSPTKNSKFFVRTPTAVCGVRGTSLNFNVAGDGKTRYGFDGDATVVGGDRVGALNTAKLSGADVALPAAELPPADAATANLPFQKSAVQALVAGEKAGKLIDTYKKNHIRVNRQASKDLAAASVARAGAYTAKTDAGVAGAVAVLDEATLFAKPIEGEEIAYGIDPSQRRFNAVLARFSELVVGTAHAADDQETMSVDAATEALAQARQAATEAKAANQVTLINARMALSADAAASASAAANAAAASAAEAEASSRLAEAYVTFAIATYGASSQQASVAAQAAGNARQIATSANQIATQAAGQADAAANAKTPAEAKAATAATVALAAAADSTASQAEGNAAVANAAATGTPEAVAAAQETVSQMQTSTDAAVKAAGEAETIAAEVAAEPDPVVAEAMAASAESKADAAMSNAAVSQSQANVAGLKAEGKTQEAEAAQQAVIKAVANADIAVKQADATVTQVAAVKAADTPAKAQAALTVVQGSAAVTRASANAAIINASESQAVTDGNAVAAAAASTAGNNAAVSAAQAQATVAQAAEIVNSGGDITQVEALVSDAEADARATDTDMTDTVTDVTGQTPAAYEEPASPEAVEPPPTQDEAAASPV